MEKIKEKINNILSLYEEDKERFAGVVPLVGAWIETIKYKKSNHDNRNKI